MLKDIFFSSVFFNPDLFAVQIPFALAALCTGGQMLLPVCSPLSRLGFLWDCRSPHAQEQQLMVFTQAMCHAALSFLPSQPEYLRGERETLSWSAQEPRSSWLLVSQATSPASPSPSLADALSYRKSAFLVL